MQTFTANEAKTRFGEFLDRAQRSLVGGSSKTAWWGLWSARKTMRRCASSTLTA
jgi:hypothetical protein